MPQDPESTRAKVKRRTPISKPPAYKPPTAATKDVKSNADRKRTSNYEKTPEYRGRVRQTYKEQPQKQRTAIAQNATGAPASAIARYHDQQMARQQRIRNSAAAKDTKSNADRNRADKFKESKQYKRDTRAAYDAQVTARRSEVAAALALRPGSPEAKSILPIHLGRVGRNKDLAASAATKDTKGNADYFRGRPKDLEAHDHQQLVDLATTILKFHKDQQYTDSSKDTKGAADFLTADAYKVLPQYAKDYQAGVKSNQDYQAKKQADKYNGVGGAITGFIHGEGAVSAVTKGAADVAGKLAPILGAAVAPAITGTLAGVDKLTGLKTLDTAKEIAKNAGEELINIPANVVPSAYYAGQPLVAGAITGDTKKLGMGAEETGRRLSQPFVDLYKHPGKTIVEHPLSTGLMVTGGVKALDRVAGRVEQRAVPGMKPRNPYPILSEKLPGTAAENLILPRQGAVASRLQARSHAKAERMSDSQIQRRVDETYYTSIHQSRQEAYAAQAQAKANGASDEQIQEVGEQTIAASREHWHDETMKDMALRDKSGRLRTYHFIEGKGGAESAIRRWGQNMINQGREAAMQDYKVTKQRDSRVLTGARGSGVQTLVPRKLQTGPNKGQYVLVPKMAADQLDLHQDYIKQTPASAILQGVSGTFRRTVLPFSPKWLSNNYTEAALRGAINTVGPLSRHEAKSVFKELGPQQQAEWNQLVQSAGHGGMQRQLLQESASWHERLAESKYENLGKALTKYGQKPGFRTMANLHNKWTDLVFGELNGRMENSVHNAMAGKVLRRNPLMSEKLVDLSKKAMQNPDGPKTVEARNTIIALGREVDRMFGKYGKFSPHMRKSIATWTPFIPWSLNAVHFITQHLPNDHPVVTSLIGSTHQAAQEWRNKHGLGYFIDGARPPFLQGAIPGGGDSSWMIFTQGTPFSAAGDPTGTAARGFNPLGSTILSNLSGRDWKGDPLPNANPYVNLETAILSMLEATTPIGYATQKVAGGAGSTSDNLKSWANPYHPVKGKKAAPKKAKKPAGLFGGSNTEAPSMFGGSSSSSGPSMFGP